MKFIYAGLFLICGSILLLQIALTRVLAIMMWHHLTYMVISVVLMGFGAAGSILTVRSNSEERPVAGRLAFHGTAYGLSVIVAFLAVTQIQVNTLEIWTDKTNLLRLALVYATIFSPFLFAGFTVGIALTRLASHVNRLYCFDLVGSAVGACASVWLLSRFDAGTVVVFAGGLGVAAGACFALSAHRRHRRATLLAAALALVTCGLFGTGIARLPIPFAPGKDLAIGGGLAIETRLPGATAEVEIMASLPSLPIIGGDFGSRDVRRIMARLVGQDGTAPTMLYQDAARLEKFPFLDDTQAASAYVTHRATKRSEPKVLVIGVGGGIDVMIALAHGARSVTAVEINQAMIDMVTRDFDDYLGGLFRPGAHAFSDRIELVHEEGRSYVRSRPNERFDVIQMSGVDSFTALSTGAYTLSESFLYTTEAVRDFYDHLEDGGYINYSRFILSRPKKPRETLRLANIAITALAELGIEDPASQILVLRGNQWASTMIKRGRFTKPEVDALEAFAQAQGFWGLVFDPLHPAGEPFGPASGLDQRVALGFHRAVLMGKLGGMKASLERGEIVEVLMSAYRHQRAGNRARADGLLQSLVARASPANPSESTAVLRRSVQRAAFDAASSEANFRDTRRDFETLLRGDSRTRRAFLEGYAYDVSPSTDDSPFFFNYYRYGALFGSSADQGDSTWIDKNYHPDYPVGHVVLLGSLAQITLLAALLILLPLRWLSRSGTTSPERWPVLAYFSSLGSGFMFVEIVLMQKTVLFLGHPTYSVAVVLASLLGFAGLGSLLAGRLDRVTQRSLRVLGLAIAGSILAEVLAMEFLLPELLGLPIPARVAAVVALIAPLGTLLGMPFPLGIRLVAERSPALLPWAWAINGFLSVFSSIFCIVLAMAVGFAAVLMLAAAIYALGFAIMISHTGECHGAQTSP